MRLFVENILILREYIIHYICNWAIGEIRKYRNAVKANCSDIKNPKL